MKKKEYIAPTMEQMDLHPVQLLSASGVNNADLDIFFGGVDVDGTIDPTAPVMPDLDSYFD